MTSFSKLSSAALFIVATAVATSLTTVVNSTFSQLVGHKAEDSSTAQQVAYRAAGRFGGFAFYRGSEHGRKIDSLAYRGSEHGRKFDSLAFYRASEHGAG